MDDRKDKTAVDVRRCAECGQEWEAPMGSPFVCPRCGLTSTLLGTHPLPDSAKQTADPLTALVKLRAIVLRMAIEVDELAEGGTTRKGRSVALSLATRMRNAAMATSMVEASRP